MRVGLLGGRRERTTVPWPGFAMEDSKGERMGIAGFCMVKGVFRFGTSESIWRESGGFMKVEERDEEWSQEDMNVVLQ